MSIRNAIRICFYWPVVLLLALGGAPPSSAQDESRWTARLHPADVRAGETAQVVVEAEIKAPWHVYALTEYRQSPAPERTTITLQEGGVLQPAGDAVQPPPHRAMDQGFGFETEYYEGVVAFALPVRVAQDAAGSQKAAVRVKFQLCKEGICLPPRPRTLDFSFQLEPGPARADRTAPMLDPPAQPAGYSPPGERTPEPPDSAGLTSDNANQQIADARRKGLLQYLLLALTMGFLALLTPCVFPMIPVTISYFSKQQEGAGTTPIRQATAYSAGIIATFCGLGLLVTALFGATGISRLATNPWVNLGLAALFVVLALNLFGVFEIGIPQGLLQGLQNQGTASKLVGPVLLGLAFSLSSFTCTVPFVGSLLASAAQGEWTWPLMGMVAFSSAFASPFFLLALFPQYLNRLPKAGGWLVVVKAFMGFLELAAAMKFLSNAELVWRVGWLTRPVFLGAWFAIFAVAGFYLLGWLRLPHSGGERAGLLRRGLGVATLGLALYVLSAADGGSVGQLTALLPPDPYPGRTSGSSPSAISWLENWDEAVAKARAEGKPIFVNFTGVTCTNCRLMEQNVLPRPEVSSVINQMVAVELYTDMDTPESRRWQQLEQKMFNTVALPLYAVVTPDGEVLGRFDGMTNDVQRFAVFLGAARDRYQRLAQKGPEAAGQSL